MSNHTSGDHPQTTKVNRSPENESQLQLQMKRLAAAQAELLAGRKSEQRTRSGDSNEQLQSENAKLRKRIEQLEKHVENPNSGRAAWSEQQKEYEALLEEKSDVIRALHQKLHDVKKKSKAAQAIADEEIPEKQELLELKRELDIQRQQLLEDEKAMMSQMQQMEMSMSKERAELARQRNEIQRMKEALDREMEHAMRDPSLQERLAALQRHQHEATNKNGDASAGAGQSKKQSSGFLRRIFG